MGVKLSEVTLADQKFIESADYRQLLTKWMTEPVGSRWFTGSTGQLFVNTMRRQEKELGAFKRDEIKRELMKEIGW